ncbi:hypothetical protein K443DRAFT_63355, partial [Laccaria amethystina LaAM-08-1]
PNAPQNPTPKISGTPIIPSPASLSPAPTDLPGTGSDDLPQDVPAPNYSTGSSLLSAPPSSPTPAVSGSIELQTPTDAPHRGPAPKDPAGPQVHQDHPAPVSPSAHGSSAPTDLPYVAPPPNASASSTPPDNGPQPTDGSQPIPSPTSPASADGTRPTGLPQGDPTLNHGEPSSPPAPS